MRLFCLENPCPARLILGLRPSKSIGFARQLKDKIDHGFRALWRGGTTHTVPTTPPAGCLTIECKAHGIQYRRLSAASGAGNQENGVVSQQTEIQLCPFQVRAKRLHGQSDRLHTSAPSPRIACKNKFRSAASTSAPHICCKNASKIAVSSVFRCKS